jgi:hypothetical protein
VAKGDWTLGDMSSLLLQMDDRSLVSPLASTSVLPVEGSAREGMLGVLTNEDIGVSREDVPVKPKEPFLSIPAVKGDTSMLPTDGPAPLTIDEGQLDEYASEFDFGEPMERGGGLFEFVEETERPSTNTQEIAAPDVDTESLEGIQPSYRERTPDEEIPADEISSGVSTPREPAFEASVIEPETLTEIAKPTSAEADEVSVEVSTPQEPAFEASTFEISAIEPEALTEIARPAGTEADEVSVEVSTPREPAFEASVIEPETLTGIAKPTSAEADVPEETVEFSGIAGENHTPLVATEPDGIAAVTLPDGTQPDGISGMETVEPTTQALTAAIADEFAEREIDEQPLREIDERPFAETEPSPTASFLDLRTELDADVIEGSTPEARPSDSNLGDLLSVLDAPREEPERRTISMSGGVPTFDAETLAGVEESVPDEIDGEMRASIESWLGREATPDELNMMMPQSTSAIPAADYYALEGIDTPPPTPTPRAEEGLPRETTTQTTETVRETPVETAGESSGAVVEGAVAQEIRDKIVRDGGAVNSKLMEQMSKDLEDRIGPLRDEVLQQASETAKGLVEDGIDDFTRGA